MTEINTSLLVYLNGLTHNIWGEYMVYIFADGPIFFAPIFLIVVWIFAAIKKNNHTKNKLLHIFYGTLIGIIFALLIQKCVHVERPETVLEGTGRLLLSHIPDASFPSDHATVGIAFAVGLWFAGYKKLFLYIFPLMILMNISRVIAGVHWPFDVIVGTGIGAISAWMSFCLLKQQKLVKKLNDFIIHIASYFKL
ncbi:phosphatase PAP2 family protein [Candidatus Gracilibacteria bacterium]|nr:phosphatase PAP2 family protein [Candidatus Gracilibacteria bacterium]